MTAPTATGLTVGADGRPRCWWGASAPEYIDYHDREWGVPLHGDDALFERLCLEAFQSGLSWLTILRKRPAFGRAFDDFRIERGSRTVHVRNAPSPGATSAMAIAEHVVDLLGLGD